MNLNIIGNEEVVDIRMDESSINIPIDLVRDTRHDDGGKIVRNVLCRESDNGSRGSFDGHVCDHALCPSPLAVIFRGISQTFLDSCKGLVVVCAEEIDGTFKREDGAHGSQGSGEGWENRTIIETACKDTRIEEDLGEGFLVVRECTVFAGLDKFFHNDGHGFDFPFKVCDDAFDVVDQDVCVAPNNVELSSAGDKVGELLLTEVRA
jgi:hypothetical protein